MNIEKLKHLALLKISGADAGTFLQGQLSNDIELLSDSLHWQLSGYCNPKGRLLALFYLWKVDSDYYALIDNSLLEPITKRLKMYVMRSKVVIETLEQAVVLGAFADQAITELTTVQTSNINHGDLVTAHANNNQDTDSDTARNKPAISILGFKQRYLLIDYTGKNSGVYDNEDRWLNANINDGLAEINANNTEQFIPQMINLDILGGINFKKGCYTGQEIIARMHYLGNLKQRLFVVDIDQTNTTSRIDKTETQSNTQDMKVFADQEGLKSVGNLVNLSADNTQALAVIKLEQLSQPLYLSNGAQLTVRQEQPYSLD